MADGLITLVGSLPPPRWHLRGLKAALIAADSGRRDSPHQGFPLTLVPACVPAPAKGKPTVVGYLG
ncbi:hypothetical protein [Trichothermofontia sp.]